MTEKPGIYRIVNQVNGKLYIGSASNISKRWSRHRKDLREGKHRNKHLQAAWTKYGEKAFLFEIVELTSELDTKEQYWIDTYDSYNTGYNLCPVARSSRGRKWSDEERKSRKHRAVNIGVLGCTPEALAKRSVTIRETIPYARKITIEIAQKIRAEYGVPTEKGLGRKQLKNGGITMTFLSTKYGLSLSTIYQIIREQIWKP